MSFVLLDVLAIDSDRTPNAAAFTSFQVLEFLAFLMACQHARKESMILGDVVAERIGTSVTDADRKEFHWIKLQGNQR